MIKLKYAIYVQKKKEFIIKIYFGFNVPYYTKNNKLTKENIFKKFIGDNELLSYLPDNSSPAYISREFLLSVLFYDNREKYLELYQQYKEIEIQKSTTGNKKFVAIITDEMKNLLQNYQPINL